MSAKIDQKCRELFEIIMNLAREIRCCSRDEAICGNVTLHQFIILDAVVKKGELSFVDLHRILSVKKSTTTRLVDPLIQKGLLKRDRSAHDSRAAMLSMTVEGMETHRKVWECLRGFFDGVMQNIPENRREEALEGVKAFTSAMQKAAASCRCCE
jgi:DNA-binding MarR family transcriptional regulator